MVLCGRQSFAGNLTGTQTADLKKIVYKNMSKTPKKLSSGIVIWGLYQMVDLCSPFP